MGSVEIKRVLNLTRRTLVVCALLSVTVFSTIGDVSQRVRSAQRYPCESHGCGCQSAARCWNQCCCFSDAAKVAWAKRNGVDVPLTVAAKVAPRAKRALTDACCDVSEPEPTVSTVVALVSAIGQARGCGGQLEWSSGSHKLTYEPPMSAWQPSIPLVARVCLLDSAWPSGNTEPPTPPPRCAA